ncbi:MAG TPA: gamma-glutamyltransferase [Deltaproteobacteria bacterium]|nr:gamma-glutamyltransferase [Deltaproteobacteria bacterium]
MKGLVAAGHELTAMAGREVLDRGGNAFDAALAAALASFAAEPAMTSPGGGGFLLSVTPSEAELYDFFPDVPGRGRSRTDEAEFFRADVSFSGAVQSFYIGRGAAAVPGVLKGLAVVHERRCTMELADLAAPAVRYAREGVRLTAGQARFHEILAPMLTASDEARAVFAPGGRLLGEGEILRNPALADTLERLAAGGLDAFYGGEFAGRILDSFGRRGLITAEDLSDYRVEVRRPLVFSYRDWTVHTNPPPSSGGCLVALALKILERFGVARLAPCGVEALRLRYETMRMVERRRGEGGFFASLYDGSLPGADSEAAAMAAAVAAALAGSSVVGGTTHISVVDGLGNAVSITTSNGEGCGYMVPATGIMLNNMLGEHDVNPLGFHRQGPGVRLSSMMAPTVAVGDGRRRIVLGSAGSRRIRSAIVSVLVNMIDHGLAVDRAVGAPRVHLEDGLLHVEGGIEAGVLRELEELGVPLRRWEGRDLFFGGVNAVSVDERGEARGAGDPRRGGVCR